MVGRFHSICQRLLVILKKLAILLWTNYKLHEFKTHLEEKSTT
eukprot:UN14401